jgi:quercetin dioxygenase-like cupin family protein
MSPRTARALSLALLVIAATGGAGYAVEPDPAVLAYRAPADLKWVDSAVFPGLKSAVLYGDPDKPGPYVVRNRFEPGSFSRPHFHPNDRLIVVLSGTWWVGTGDKFDPESTKPMAAGSFVIHYAGKVHYDGAKDEACEVLIYGIGPATATRVGAN